MRCNNDGISISLLTMNSSYLGFYVASKIGENLKLIRLTVMRLSDLTENFEEDIFVSIEVLYISAGAIS
jgi:hypothetical protein